jgi:hypothetical protein
MKTSTYSGRRGVLPALGALLLLAALFPLPAAGIQISPRAEQGYIGVLSHVYRVGSTANGNVDFNFLTQGGQDILFPYQRYSGDVVLAGQHRVTALYQPLTLNTRSVAARNGTGAVKIDGVDFLNLPIDITYGFDFWRLSYLYDFARDPATILGVGLSLQIRNASIVFTSVDGSLRVVQQNIGPVPILKVRAARWFTRSFGLDFEVDGFYASSAFFNGSTKPFEGWIWDASISAKTRVLPGSAAFLTVRSIGGGASGSNAYPGLSSTKGTNPETYNALATLAVTLGLSIE